jgi:hypothetical protein
LRGRWVNLAIFARREYVVIWLGATDCGCAAIPNLRVYGQRFDLVGEEVPELCAFHDTAQNPNFQVD